MYQVNLINQKGVVVIIQYIFRQDKLTLSFTSS